MIKFLDLQHQYRTIQSEIDQAIEAVLSAASFVGGPHVARFEREFAEYQSSEHCVGVGNGTDALEIALEALELPPGSEVIVPANSFIASSEAVTRCGLTVVFADVDSNTYLLDATDVERRVTAKTSAIIAVHLYGNPCDMDALSEIAGRHDLKIVEDAAQAHGASWKGKRVGALGDVGTFSFYPGKNLGAYGDGGAIVTNNSDLALKCRMIANHGRVAKYSHEFEGRNSRLDALQAAVLSVKLGHLPQWTQRRSQIASRYMSELSGVGDLNLPQVRPAVDHSFHLFVIRSRRRAELAEFLSNAHIEIGRHYPHSLPKLEAYAHLGPIDYDMLANKMDEELLSLPIGEHLSDSDVDYVIEHVVNFYKDSDHRIDNS